MSTLTTMATSVVRAVSRPRSYVRVSGPDAEDYLQRMLSNHVTAGELVPALLLTPKSRLIAPLRVWRRGPEDFLLLTEPGLGEGVRSTLVRSRFAAQCEIELEEHTSAVVFGDAEGLPGEIPGTVEVLDAQIEAGGDLERARIEAGVPVWGKELDDSILPAEAGLDETHVSFTKGCYPGQEPVARLRHRGKVNRRLRVLEVEGDELPAYDAELDARRQGRSAGSRARSPRRTRAGARPTCVARSPTTLCSPRLAQRDAATLTLPAPVAQGIERCPVPTALSQALCMAKQGRCPANGTA